MATPDQIPTDLTLDLGDDLAPEDFVAAVRNFFGYANEIADTNKGSGQPVRWTVKVKEGSNLVALSPSKSSPQTSLGMIYEQVAQGIDALAKGDISGSGLTEKAIGHLRNLSDLAPKTDVKNGIKLWVLHDPIVIGRELAETIREDWETDYYDIGTIEGRVEVIQDANGALKIRVRDFLHPKPIGCVVTEKMIETVLSSFRRRVEIEGRIHYRKNGTPISIEASQIDLLPEDSELPSAADVRGILAVA